MFHIRKWLTMDLVRSGRLDIGGGGALSSLDASSLTELSVICKLCCVDDSLTAGFNWPLWCDSESVGVLLGELLLTWLNDDAALVLNEMKFSWMTPFCIKAILCTYPNSLQLLWPLYWPYTWNLAVVCYYFRTNWVHLKRPADSFSAPVYWCSSSWANEPMLQAFPVKIKQFESLIQKSIRHHWFISQSAFMFVSPFWVFEHGDEFCCFRHARLADLYKQQTDTKTSIRIT